MLETFEDKIIAEHTKKSHHVILADHLALPLLALDLFESLPVSGQGSLLHHLNIRRKVFGVSEKAS